MLLGGALVLAAQIWGPDESERKIVVDAQRVERLAQLYALQTGAPPTEAERARLVADFVRDEALYREARWLGLDDGDELVRRRMVQKMEFLMASADEPATPDEGELRRFHQEHADEFVAPARLTLVHVYFSPDGRGREAAFQAATAALSRQGEADPGLPAGDRSPVPSRFENVTLEELRLAFGDRPIVPGLAAATPGRWTGPLESGFGWHLVRVIEQTPAQAMSFDQARDQVTDAWLRAARAQSEQKRLTALTQKYPVVYSSRPELLPEQEFNERVGP